MKSILLSIKPEWTAKILNGEKTIEVRKKFPKDYVGWVYLYCSKEHNGWCMVGINGHKSYCEKYSKKSVYSPNTHEIGNGRVVARFWCDRVLPIIKVVQPPMYYYTCKTERFYYNPDKLKNGSCLNDNQLNDYLGDKGGYAIHISKLEIFDRPRELSEFRVSCEIHKNKLSSWTKSKCKKCSHLIDYQGCDPKLTKAPQNYCYVEGE